MKIYNSLEMLETLDAIIEDINKIRESTSKIYDEILEYVDPKHDDTIAIDLSEINKRALSIASLTQE